MFFTRLIRSTPYLRFLSIIVTLIKRKYDSRFVGIFQYFMCAQLQLGKHNNMHHVLRGLALCGKNQTP